MQDTHCKTKLPVEVELEDDENSCENGEAYELKVDTNYRWVQDEIGRKPPIDVEAFTLGSVYGSNWCEVVDSLEATLNNLKSNK